MEDNKKQEIDLSQVFRTLWGKRKKFIKVWVWTFILSCIWIFPQPRYYTSEVMLAPEMSGDDVGSGLSSIASSFGFNIGGMTGMDAIYPELYPDLFESPEFIVGLYGIDIKTKDGEIATNYFTYMKEHQKKNVLGTPFRWVKKQISSLIEPEDNTPRGTGKGDINPFMMNRKDYDLMQTIMDKVNCAIDKKTSVITIHVEDQDPLVCAIMADSVKQHLQDFIIRYRTSKAKEDVMHYQQMRDSAEQEYDLAMKAYSRFCDTHKGLTLQSYQSERDKLENDLGIKQTSLSALETQLQSTKVKLQEKTPAFTTLKSATVPVKPAGPKRMLFIIGMLILATTIKGYLLIKDTIMS